MPHTRLNPLISPHHWLTSTTPYMVAATLDDHAPLTNKRITIKPNYPWLREDLR